MGPGHQVLCHRDRAAHPGLWGARTGWRPTSGSPATGCLTRHRAGAGSELGFSGSRLKINMERSNDGKGRVACPGSWQPEGGRTTAPEPRGPRGRQREDGRQQEQAWRPVWRCPSWVRAQEAHPGEAGPPGLDTSLHLGASRSAVLQIPGLGWASQQRGGSERAGGAVGACHRPVCGVPSWHEAQGRSWFSSRTSPVGAAARAGSPDGGRAATQMEPQRVCCGPGECDAPSPEVIIRTSHITRTPACAVGQQDCGVAAAPLPAGLLPWAAPPAPAGPPRPGRRFAWPKPAGQAPSAGKPRGPVPGLSRLFMGRLSVP